VYILSSLSCGVTCIIVLAHRQIALEIIIGNFVGRTWEIYFRDRGFIVHQFILCLKQMCLIKGRSLLSAVHIGRGNMLIV